MPLNIDLFIEAVKSRPVLYDKKVKGYTDIGLKKKLWWELCTEFVKKWEELSNKEKREKVEALQKKWKNLRTCFKREYEAQKNVASGSGDKKRRKYIYFDQLLFLRDTIKSPTTSNSIQQKNSCDDEQKQSEKMTAKTGADRMAKPSTRSTVSQNQVLKKSCSPKSDLENYEESILQILKEIKNEEQEIDEDKYFLLSLLPSFKKFNEDQKFLARMHIMNVMRHVRVSEDLATTTLNTGIPKLLILQDELGNIQPLSHQQEELDLEVSDSEKHSP